MKKNLVITLLCFIFCSSVYGQNFDSVQVKSTKLSESIYMLEGAGGNIGDEGIKQRETVHQIVETDPLKGYIVIVDKWFFVQSIHNSLKK